MASLFFAKHDIQQRAPFERLNSGLSLATGAHVANLVVYRYTSEAVLRFVKSVVNSTPMSLELGVKRMHDFY